MNPDVIKEKIRIEQHKFEIVYLKNLWTVILGLGGFIVMLLQLLFSQQLSLSYQKVILIILSVVMIFLSINFLRYLTGRRKYIKMIDELFKQIETYYAKNIEEK